MTMNLILNRQILNLEVVPQKIIKPMKTVSFSDQVIIIDNIVNPANLSNSKKISEKLKSSETETVEFAYPLVKGGVAHHFKDSQNAQRALDHWPGQVFGEKEERVELRLVT